jgi:hypothetical protein
MNTKHLAPILLTLVLTACGGGPGGSGGAGGSAASGGAILVASIGSQTNLVYNEAVGDINGDGLEDVVVSGWNSDSPTAYLHVYTQNSNGTLSDQTSTLLSNNVIKGSQRVLIADFNRDGHTDIFVPGFRDGSAIVPANSVMFWGTGGQLRREDWTDASEAHGACIADLNADGNVDMLVAGSGVFINNGSSFTLNTTMLANNYFEACAVIAEGATNTIYLANNNSVAGFKDAIAVYDHTLTLVSATGYQADANFDTIDVVAADLTGDGHKDFVISINGVAINAPGPREVLAYAGPNTYSYSNTLETARSLYYGRELQINGTDSVFFSGDSSNASVYMGTTKYKPNDIVAMGGNAYNPVIVYQNSSTNKTYMLELVNNSFYTQEMK